MFSLKICKGPTSHLNGQYLTPQALTNRVLILLKADMISRWMQHFPFVLSVIVDICQQWEEVQVNLQWRAWPSDQCFQTMKGFIGISTIHLVPTDYKNHDKKDLNWRSNCVGVNDVAVLFARYKFLNVWFPFAWK